MKKIQKGKDRLPSIYFQVQTLSFREGMLMFFLLVGSFHPSFGLGTSIYIWRTILIFPSGCFFPPFFLPKMFVQQKKHGLEIWDPKLLRKGRDTLQGTNISHLGKRKIIFKSDFWWDMHVFGRSERRKDECYAATWSIWWFVMFRHHLEIIKNVTWRISCISCWL